jgi:uncharacterized protein YdhG (YjbR/CyaY superfamily)
MALAEAVLVRWPTMNKPKSSRGKSRKSAPITVDDYIATVPEAARDNFFKLRAAIRSAVPKGSVETISYRIPAFKREGVLVWFAAFAKHCSLFPTASVIEAFKHELQGFSTSKGTIQFPTSEPLPVGLIKRIVKARVAQHRAKSSKS